jgi:hypothetical protein
LAVDESRYRDTCVRTLLIDDSRTRQEARDISNWNGQIITLLVRLTSRLSDTVRAWDRFKEKDMYYFLFDEDNGSLTSSSSLKSSVNSVDDCFLDLKDILKKLCHLEMELLKYNPQGVSHLSCPKLMRSIFLVLTDTGC